MSPSNFQSPPLNFQLPPQTFQSPTSNTFGNFHISAQISLFNSKNDGLTGNLFFSQTQTLTREKQKNVRDDVQQQLDYTLYELPDHPPKLELGDGLLNSLGVEADDVLHQEFVSNKELQDATLEQIKEEYEASVPAQLDFFYGGENINFVRAAEFLSLNQENREFIAFLLSDQGQNLITNNELPIHIESGDIFYQNFKTNENFYNFLMAQQNDETANVPKRISYHHSFENYMKNFLPLFSLDDVDKFDLYSNKNAKYLFYRFNDFIKKSGGKKQIIKHTLKIKDSVCLKKIENKNRQFLVEKKIHGVEFQNLYEDSIEKKPGIIETVEKNYEIIRKVYQYLFTEVADIFLKYIHSLDSDEIQ